MYEVEIKVPADLDAVRDRLREAGAERVDARRQRDVYYDAPHRDFAATDEALRVRRETSLAAEGDEKRQGNRETDREPAETDAETAKITYKGPLLDDDSKTRAEHETAVDDGEAIAEIVAGLGFEPAATVEKRREFWSYDGFTVTLDAVTDVGEFVEIERAVGDAAAIETVRDEALDALDRLGLDGDDQVRTSYLELLLTEE
ncbi:class IV adenylate cyclase [Halorubrum sp. CBA1125]|uniref:class IV adenylate cyclase n=1 Tax=Halorubrum sp. CBA1125 TaxID=2668072 RepID=UPI0012E7A1F8|nr:class IV adenylate cyclase [Halorubrum sp. CBA1125]MUW13546.1 class IV adenylate cyclase [Halorubrum sp. CBA1125]